MAIKIKNTKKVFVAMSGGVDSSVAAALLKTDGFDVRGVHIKMWSPKQLLRDATGQADPYQSVCKQQHQDRLDAMRVAAKLNIPFETWDFTDEYRKAVVEYMIREYAAGRTPNPDVMCNREIKFGIFLKRALEEGADYIATGHYVRINNQKSGTKKLRQAKDLNKDQSYFLWTLTQPQLRHCIFPIGEYTKPEVRAMAKKFDLPTAEKPDSQGICFIGEINMSDFLKKYIKPERGTVKTSSGRVIGRHEGLSFYTIGQREGLKIGGGIPYYVAEKDFKNNILVVAEGPYDEKLFSTKLVASDVNWITGNVPKLPLSCKARIRYRQPLQEAQVVQYKLKVKGDTIKENKFLVKFKEPQRAITEGQSVVFYENESFGGSQDREMLGGGIIEKGL